MGCGCFARKLVSTLAASVLLLIVVNVPSHAQGAGATLSGVVSDTTGAVVPNARVSIKNSATGIVREVTTNSDGYYTAPNLLPGDYELTVTAAKFGTVVQPGIKLAVGATQAVNVALKVGNVNEKVEVNALAPQVETTSSTLRGDVNSTTVRELPLNGRDWTQLATLEPGVASIHTQASTSSTANRGNRGFGDQLTDSGHRPNENTYLVNGININDYSNGAPGSVLGVNLGVDAIQEFTVLTSNYTAEYGRTSGAVISAISKSGTNGFHGDGYVFDRDKIFDARNFFDPAQIPPFRRVQFGGSAGGPIVKDKTFIFGDFERIEQDLSGSSHQVVPSGAVRALPICTVSPSPSNGSCVDPKVAPYLSLWPQGNAGPVPNSNGQAEFWNGSKVSSLRENYFTVRLDHHISNNDSLDGSYYYDNAPQTQPDAMGNNLNEVFTRRQGVTTEETHIFGPRLVNTMRFGFNRVVGLVNNPVTALNPAAKDPTLAAVPGKFAPLLDGTGFGEVGGFGSISFFGHHWNSAQAYDDLVLNKGTHTLKLGGAFERMQYNCLSKVRQDGNFRFGGKIDNFLADIPTNVLLLDPNFSQEIGMRSSLIAGYIQDDWHVKSNLTLNIGMRYEMITNPTDSGNRLMIVTNINGGTPVHVNNLFASNPTTKDFAPRIGFSWDPTHKGRMAIRGGVGIFDVLPLPYMYTIGTSIPYPFGVGLTQNNLQQGDFPTIAPSVIASFNPSNLSHTGVRYVDQNPRRGYATNWNLNIQRDLGGSTTATIGYVGSRTQHTTYAADDANTVVGTPTPSGLLFPHPQGSGSLVDPNVGFIRPLMFNGAASYEALQAQLRKTMSHGLQAQMSYTWGNCMDLGSAAQLGDPYLNSISSLIFYSQASRRGLCDFNVKHNISANMVWMVPGPKSGATSAILGGWQVGTIVSFSTGTPFTVVMGGDPLGQNNSDPFDYPDRLYGQSGCNTAVNPGNVNQYVNLNCFTVPVAPASMAAQCTPFSYSGVPANSCMELLGNAGRNRLIGPGLFNTDFSIFKNFPVRRLSEGANLQFRAEFFNVFNHTNFQSPVDNTTLFNQDGSPVGGAGALSQTTTTSRQIQLGLKFNW